MRVPFFSAPTKDSVRGSGDSPGVHSISPRALFKVSFVTPSFNDGEILLDEVNIQSFKSKHYAKKVGFLEQNHYINYAFTVREIVEMGRYAYEDKDSEMIDNALNATGLKEMESHSVLTLSGGEMQRTFLLILLSFPSKDLGTASTRMKNTSGYSSCTVYMAFS